MRCKAKSKRSGEQCKRHATPGREVCAIHGGKTPAGIASPHAKDLRYSKYFPDRLLERYAQAVADEDLLNLKFEIALIDTRVGELLEQLGRMELTQRAEQLAVCYQTMEAASKQEDLDAWTEAFKTMGALIHESVNDKQVWEEVIELLEQRRKLVDTERKRLVEMEQYVTSEQALMLVTALASIVREEVVDRDVLARIQTRIMGILSQRTRRPASAAAEGD